MKRKEKQPTAILCGDLHIRETVPQSRIDDYLAAQDRKLEFLRKLQLKYDCPIFDAGDVFDTWRCSHGLTAYAIQNLPNQIYTIPGNHDLPSLSLDKFNKSPINVLYTAGDIYCLFPPNDSEGGDYLYYKGFPWGTKPHDLKEKIKSKIKIALCHYFVYEDEGVPGVESERGIDLLKRLKSFDLIVTGHNHKSFVVEYKGRLLVNPGSMMRMAADQFDHKPRVYLWYAESNTVEPIYFPIEPSENVLSREHITVKEESNEMLESFVSRLKEGYEVSLSYKDNLEKYFTSNRTQMPVKKMVWEAVDGGNNGK